MKPPITIVGPRSDDDDGAARERGSDGKGNGLNALLMMAASDAEFSKRLLHDREALLEEVNDQLTDEEVEMLREIPNSQLRRMIDGQRLDEEKKRSIKKAILTVGIITTLLAVMAWYVKDPFVDLMEDIIIHLQGTIP